MIYECNFIFFNKKDLAKNYLWIRRLIEFELDDS